MPSPHEFAILKRPFVIPAKAGIQGRGTRPIHGKINWTRYYPPSGPDLTQCGGGLGVWSGHSFGRGGRWIRRGYGCGCRRRGCRGWNRRPGRTSAGRSCRYIDRVRRIAELAAIRIASYPGNADLATDIVGMSPCRPETSPAKTRPYFWTDMASAGCPVEVETGSGRFLRPSRM